MQLNHFECDTVCGFSVQGFEREEIVKISMDHVKRSHTDAHITDEMVQGLVKTVDVKS